MAKRRGACAQFLDSEDPRGYDYALMEIDLLVPDPENPRIPPQEAVLDTLALEREPTDAAFNPAKDIVAQGGGNPAELLEVTLLPR